MTDKTEMVLVSRDELQQLIGASGREGSIFILCPMIQLHFRWELK